MWHPTVGTIIGFIKVDSFWRGTYYETVFRSHTGKKFSIDFEPVGVIDKEEGDVIFCNGDLCAWYPDFNSAVERLTEVQGKTKTITRGNFQVINNV